MIRLSGVKKAYNQGLPSETWAVRGVDLELEAGKVTVLMGPSGSGKTTLLTLIGGLARPTEGRVRVRDLDVSALPEHFLTQVRRKTFGFVFQQHNLIRGLDALENVMIPAYPLGPDPKALAGRALGILERLGLAPRAKEKVERLSGGEAQRVAFARALVNDPEVIIADEPTANLDSALSKEILAIITELKQEGRTVLLTSHDPRVQQDPVVDRTVVMRDGRVEGGGP